MNVILTYDEFKLYGGDPKKVTPDKFDLLLANAEQVINVQTQGFYDDPDKLASDPIKFRTKRYKQAITQQIMYFANLGVTSVTELMGRLKSQSIGETSVSYGDIPTDSQGRALMLAPEARSLLEDTGLLYRGVPLCRPC